MFASCVAHVEPPALEASWICDAHVGALLGGPFSAAQLATSWRRSDPLFLAERINRRNTFKSFNLHRFTGLVSPIFALLRMTPAKFNQPLPHSTSPFCGRALFSVFVRRAIAAVRSVMSADSASASLKKTASDGCVWPNSSRATNERWTSARCANSSWLMFSCARLALISAATALTTASSCVFLMPRNVAMSVHLYTCIYGTK